MTITKTCKRILLIFLIEFPPFLLNLPRGRNVILLSLAAWFLLCIFLAKSDRSAPEKSSGLSEFFNISYPLSSVILALIFAALFYFRWHRSGVIHSLSKFQNLSSEQFLLIAVIFTAFLSITGIDYLIRTISTVLFHKKTFENTETPLFTALYIFITSFLTISLHSKCSPLYPINPWGDPNCMMTVGKGVLKGYVPYRDLYEQKGPLLLFFHMIGAAISFTGFTGIWILEILFCFMFLFLVYRTAALFFDRRMIVLLPLLSSLIYSRWAFEAGDTAEEFCLPLLAYGVYTACKALKKDGIPSPKEFFLIGITSGCVFWIKYSMTGFYAGWFIILLIFSLKKGYGEQFFRGLGRIFFGVMCPTLLILLYFTVTGSLTYLFRVYFYNLIFIYAKSESSVLRNLSGGYEYLRLGNSLSIFSWLAGLLWFCYHRQWKQTAFISAAFLSTFLFIFFSEKRFIYYGLIFSIFVVFGFFWLAEFLRLIDIKKHFILSLTLSLFGSMMLLCFFSRNISYLENRKEDLMQYKIMEVINEFGMEDPTILEYKTASTGVNTVTGTIPNTRYFCSFTIPLDEMKEEQDRCFEEGCADFVIIETREIYDFQEYDQYIHLGGFEGNIHDTKRPYFYHCYIRK